MPQSQRILWSRDPWMGMSAVFLRPMTTPLHCPTGTQIRSMPWDCEILMRLGAVPNWTKAMFDHATWWRQQMAHTHTQRPVTRSFDLMYSLIWAWTNGGANHRDAGGLKRRRAHYDVTVMKCLRSIIFLVENVIIAQRSIEKFHLGPGKSCFIIQWNLCVTTTSKIKSITCDLFSYVV